MPWIHAYVYAHKGNIMNKYIALYLPFLFNCLTFACAQETTNITFQLASEQHLDAVIQLINEHACKEHDKIVILPERFRRGYILQAIKDKRLFLALAGTKIIGYKKLFVMTDDQELHDTLVNEFRCKGTDPASVGSLSINSFDTLEEQINHVDQATLNELTTYVYNGSDFTHPEYRGNRINEQLTCYALHSISKNTAALMKHTNSTGLALAYGLTHDNAGQEQQLLGGRSRSIVRSYLSFLKDIVQQNHYEPPTELALSRYHACKPSFDPQDTECRPLDDSKSIPGYGCLITCLLTQADAHKEKA